MYLLYDLQDAIREGQLMYKTSGDIANFAVSVDSLSTTCHKIMAASASPWFPDLPYSLICSAHNYSGVSFSTLLCMLHVHVYWLWSDSLNLVVIQHQSETNHSFASSNWTWGCSKLQACKHLFQSWDERVCIIHLHKYFHGNQPNTHEQHIFRH